MNAPPPETAVDASPFDLSPASGVDPRDAAALCLHGLTGTPYEVRPLAEALARRGIRARGPVLPGHDSTPEELSRVDHRDWLDFVRAEYRALREQHAHVFLVGVSMGGLLSLALAAEGDCEGLGVVGSPLAFSWPIRTFVPLAKYLMPMAPKKTGPDISDPEARHRHPGYDVMPLASVHQLMHLQKLVRAALSRVRAPTLIAHGSLDSTADPRDAQIIHRGIAAAEKRVMYFERSAHVVPVDYDGAALASEMADFMERRLSAAGPD